jgi:hypothetical protein
MFVEERRGLVYNHGAITRIVLVGVSIDLDRATFGGYGKEALRIRHDI